MLTFIAGLVVGAVIVFIGVYYMFTKLEDR